MQNEIKNWPAENLILSLRESTLSSFYRDLWKDSPTSSLPILTREHLMRTPLRSREYKKKKGLVKIVRAYGKPFLSKWALEDLYGKNLVQGRRPLVLLADTHETQEQGLALYAQGILPLIGETSNVAVTVYCSVQYEIDGVITDASMYEAIARLLKEKYDTAKIHEWIFFVTNKTDCDLVSEEKNATYLLSLPETGIIARSCTHKEASRQVFHPEDSVNVEYEEGELVVTKNQLLVTPIIRYKSGINSKACVCGCGREGLELT